MERRNHDRTIENKVSGRNRTTQMLKDMLWILFFILKTSGSYWRVLSKEIRADFYLRNQSGEWIRGEQEWVWGEMMELWTRRMDIKWNEVKRFNKRVKSIDLDDGLTVEMKEKQVLRLTLNLGFHNWIDSDATHWDGILGKFQVLGRNHICMEKFKFNAFISFS